jgi:lipoprotein-anchoring transpeptidase ErfK/SrfK
MKISPESSIMCSLFPLSRLRFWRNSCQGLASLLLCFGLVSCKSTPPKTDVVVSVKDQKLGVYDMNGKLVKTYKISTSKFGLGDQPGSNRTPLGVHEIVAKIGHGLPKGAVLKSRSWNGEVIQPDAPGRDPIVSRILWLKGLESDNKNAYKRFIYIHGTPEERNLGRPASYGCIRMGMEDVIKLFEELRIGAKVKVTPKALPKS